MTKILSMRRGLILVVLVAGLVGALSGCDALLNILGMGSPTADGGGDRSVEVATLVTLDGTLSVGDGITYKWAMTKPTGSTAALSSTTASKVTFTPDVAGTYDITLTVTNSNGSGKITFTITATMPAGFYTAPTGLAVAIASGQATLTWTAALDGMDNPADSYEVYKSNSQTGFYSKVTNDTDPTDLSYVASITSTQVYWLKVKAKYGVSNLSDFSTPIKADGATTTQALTLTAPTGLVATTASITYNSIPLAWTAVIGATGYDIQRSTSSTGTYSSITSGATGISYTDTSGLSPTTTYYYQIRATATGVTSSWSAFVAAATIAQPTASFAPGAPTILVGSPTSTSLSISWTAPAATATTGTALYFEVSMSSDNGVTWNVAGSNISASPFAALNLLASTTYKFKARGVNSAGPGEWSAIVSGTTSAAAVTQLVPSSAPVMYSGVITQNSIEVKWYGLTDAQSYQVQYKSATMASFVDVAGASNTSLLNATQTGLSASTPYTFQIRGKNTVGFGPWSGPVSFTTLAPVASQTVPTGSVYVYFNGQTQNSINVSWSVATNASYYVVTLSATSPTVATYDQLFNVNQTQVTFNGLQASSTYYVKVVAWNGAGAGSSGTGNTMTTAAPTATQTWPPTAPYGLSANPYVSGTSTYASLSWYPSSGWNAAGSNYYTIFRKGPYDTAWQWAGQVNQNSTYFTDYWNGFMGGQEYQYKVVASNVFTTGAVLSSGESNIASYFAPNGIAPVVHLTDMGNGTVQLFWDYNPQVYYIEVYVSYDGGATWPVSPYWGDYAQYYSNEWFYGLTTATRFRVVAYDSNWNSAQTEIDYVPPTTGGTVPVTITVH